MVLAGVSLEDRTGLYRICKGSVTAERYIINILKDSVVLYALIYRE